MTKIRNCFGGVRMTWPKVLIMAVVTGAYTALINQVPFLYDTSLTDIAVNLECWVLFAVFIISNCRKWWEASLKCFVFFLISQPLVYLIEVPFSDMGWKLFDYYKYWFVITVLTLPGAAVAFLIKRKDFLSVASLSVANGYLAYQGVDYLRGALADFPRHILSAVFCFALAVFFCLVFFTDKKHRIAAFSVIAVVVIAASIYTGRNASTLYPIGEGSWSYSIQEDDGGKVQVEITDENQAKIKAKKDGHVYVTFTSGDGEEKLLYITVSGGGIWIDELDP